MSDVKTLLVLEENNPQLKDALDFSRLTKLLGSQKDLETATVDPTAKAEFAAAVEKLCGKQDFKGIVLAGSACFLNGLPDVFMAPSGQTGHRPVKVNLLERCANLHPDKAQATTLAARQIEVAAAKAANRFPVVFVDTPVEKQVAILGYGDAGCLVKDALVDQGFAVTMIAPPEAGKDLPSNCTSIADSRLVKVEGASGRFLLTVETPSGKESVKSGAIVVATPAELKPVTLKSVPATPLTQWAENLANGAAKERVCVVLDYQKHDARIMATAAMKALEKAMELGQTLYLAFRHMPVYGREGQKRYDTLRNGGLKVLRYQNLPAFFSDNGAIRVEVQDTILPEKIMTFTVDRVVMPETLLSHPSNPMLAQQLNQPLDADGFLQPMNVRHFPVASPRRGVFYVGPCHGDVDAEETAVEAAAAAAEIAGLLGAGTVRVPRELVTVNKDVCASCLTCLRSCRHSAIVMGEDVSVEFMADACWECGVCASVCPRRAISRTSFSLDQFQAAVKKATAELNGAKPVVAFLCRNSAAQALESAGREKIALPDDVIFIELPCAGHISESEVLFTLENGARRVEVFGCHHDNCRSVIGSISADKRTGAVRKSLTALEANPDLVRYHSLAANEAHRLAHILWKASE